MKARAIPLTMRWYLLLWRGGSRLAAGPVRVYEEGNARTIGGTLSIAGFTTGLAYLGTTPPGTTENWYRDFGRFSIGGWRTCRNVPLSTGWVLGNDERAGALITVASRTFYLLRMWTRADYREYRAECALHGRGARPHSGRERKRRSR
ncbi:hypothetical protein ACWDZ4_20220 [Streptomyces sp. NPDC003016]